MSVGRVWYKKKWVVRNDGVAPMAFMITAPY